MWPQYTVIGLGIFSLGINLVKFGQPKTDSYGWTELLIGPALSYWVLYEGGFFAGLGFTP
jgi:hypothetical protein